MNNFWSWLEGVKNDIIKAADTVGVDIVRGIQYLLGIFPEIEQGAVEAAKVVEFIDPQAQNLATIIAAVSQLTGSMDATVSSMQGIGKLISNFNENNLASTIIAIKADMPAVLADIEKTAVIWGAQKNAVMNALTQIMQEITKTPAAQDIENVLKNL